MLNFCIDASFTIEMACNSQHCPLEGSEHDDSKHTLSLKQITSTDAIVIIDHIHTNNMFFFTHVAVS